MSNDEREALHRHWLALLTCPREQHRHDPRGDGPVARPHQRPGHLERRLLPRSAARRRAAVISVEIFTDGLSARIKTDAHYSPDLADDLVNRTVHALRDTVIQMGAASVSFEAFNGEG